MKTPDDLLEMLTYRRPAGSKAERKFIARFIRPLGVTQDSAGNLIKRIGDAPVLWSCHTDTVHRSGGRQTILEQDGMITAPYSSCLGADDTAGIWLMVNMIQRGVPGLYVFHRAEEVGGYGSMHIANACRDLLLGIDCAIALDRYGTTSVITEQWGGRCCSNSFATALATSLDLGMRLDPGGSFTDTANYMEIIPECTNISVGYYKQHTKDESLDPWFLMQLLERLCVLDVTSLPIVRSPQPSYDDWSSVTFSTTGREQEPVEAPDGWTSHGLDHYDALREVVKRYPDAVADFLDGYGITADEVLNHFGTSDERLAA